MDRHMTRSAASKQAENPAGQRSTALKGTKDKQKVVNTAATSSAAAKKKSQKAQEKQREKEERTDKIRKRKSKMMEEDEASHDEEDIRPQKKKKSRSRNDNAQEEDEPANDTAQGNKVADMVMQDQMADSEGEQPKKPRPMPKRKYGQHAKPAPTLDADEEDLARTLVTFTKKQDKGKNRANNNSDDERSKSPAASDDSRKNSDKAKRTAAGPHDKPSDDSDQDDSSKDDDQEEGEAYEDDRDEEDEEETDHAEEGQSDDNGMIVLSDSRRKGKGARPKAYRTGGAKGARLRVSDLPTWLVPLFHAAQDALRLRTALKSAWTKEPSVVSKRLPSVDDLIKASVQDAYEKGDKKDRKGKDNSQRERHRQDMHKLIVRALSQTRNELKGKASQVIQKAYDLSPHLYSLDDRRPIALWLIGKVSVKMGDRTALLPRFIFGEIEHNLGKEQGSSVEKSEALIMNYIMSKYNRLLPFRHPAIQELIYLYWGPAKREGACIKAAMVDFKKVPLNLIALVCTAIEGALADVAAQVEEDNEVNLKFANSVYAKKWDSLMSALEYMNNKPYLQETQSLIWSYIRSKMQGDEDGDMDAVEENQEEEEDGERVGGAAIDLDQLNVTLPAVASGSKAKTPAASKTAAGSSKDAANAESGPSHPSRSKSGAKKAQESSGEQTSSSEREVDELGNEW
ncbi:uncharacterized protein C8Q71DRAFT_721175 [Rhodofomes roseus]|uniref:DUF6532 domain-containing protein n=1 Tax=Rhodofomes roseus TaxID=34475 RepID=A0ABQ8KRC4_9APHY|nr:uncharacterized protein C8Q71DRAFT_721175 [Rhodofomes roseus]KAH9840670.1 hypothetical protein C8Q71DRAFT_721175 [Rhodofomes roseus]